MPSPLASIYSTADSFKRSLLDMLSNPVEAAQQIVGNANDRAGILNQLTAEAAQEGRNGGPLFGPKSQQLAGTLADAYNPAGMIVYHGSPFKFDAFAPKAIGSGEGAQAYGYGHYVAENPAVANEYANMPHFKRGKVENPEVFGSGSKSLLDRIEKFGDLNKAKNEVESVLQEMRRKNIFPTVQEDLERELFLLNKFGDKTKVSKTNIGSNIYKIDLPDDQIAKMLDWDAEISKQTPEIQALAKQFGLASDDLGGDLVAAMNAKKPAGAEQMRQAGVTGIRYYDAQSRGGQKADTRNFVVFPQNEGLLNILERNGVPLK